MTRPMPGRTTRTGLALAFPIAGLALLALAKSGVLAESREVTLPIAGFDPRDLLSGHYLTYRVDFGAEGPCRPGDSFVCVNPAAFHEQKPDPNSCPLFIRGDCRSGHFVAGIERFYVPEAYSIPLDAAVRGNRGKVVLAVAGDGTARARDLLIADRPWREFLTDLPAR